MRAGRLNRKISIRSIASTARSTDGQPLESETTVLSNIWADCQPIKSEEIFRQDVRWTGVTKRFVIRYSTAVDTTCRVYEAATGEVYEIVGLIDVDDARRTLEIMAKRTT